MGANQITVQAVLEAISEYDQLGRDRFLSKYGYKPARRYHLVHERNHYDSKAIFGVARGKASPSLGVLKPSEFSGGEATVARRLRSLGFVVVSTPATSYDMFQPLILVENEATYGGRYDHWQDQTGVRYHFPNIYKGKIQTGRRFIYYRGVRRRGGRIGAAGYFGCGVVGYVWRDNSVDISLPRRHWKWFCDIEDFVPFPRPVPIKINGNYFETVPGSLGWRTGVRTISEGAYRKILSYSGITPVDSPTRQDSLDVPPPVFPPITDVDPRIASEPMDAILRISPISRGDSAGGGQTVGPRRSRNAKIMGDRAEEIVYHWLTSQLPAKQASSIKWCAREGETPGWDIEFTDGTGAKNCIEVKGTTGPAFHSIEITASEWAAAERLRHHFWLMLVTDCASTSPRLAKIQDPYSLYERGAIQASVLLWRLEKSN